MKNSERDILNQNPELKKMPYSVPDGYFEEFKLKMKPSGAGKTAGGKAAPYLAVAASVALLLATGLHFVPWADPADEFTYEDFLVFSDSMADTEYYERDNMYADAGIANEDIINYLIYDGVTAEEIENYK